ncbi:hypothetical protein RQN30_04635 [Arcanobacterium hippocoleae]
MKSLWNFTAADDEIPNQNHGESQNESLEEKQHHKFIDPQSEETLSEQAELQKGGGNNA